MLNTARRWQKRTLDLDVIGYTINAASIMLEKLDKELERQYNSIIDKDDETTKKVWRKQKEEEMSILSDEV